MTDDGIVDEVAVERACEGDLTVGLTPTEAAAVWRTLEARGLSAAAIAGRMGVDKRQIVRWRAGDVNPSGRHAAHTLTHSA